MEEKKDESRGKDVEGAKEKKEKVVEVGWNINRDGVMTTVITLANVHQGVFILERALRHLHHIVDCGEAQKEAAKKQLLKGDSLGSGVKKDKTFFNKVFGGK